MVGVEGAYRYLVEAVVDVSDGLVGLLRGSVERVGTIYPVGLAEGRLRVGAIHGGGGGVDELHLVRVGVWVRVWVWVWVLVRPASPSGSGDALGLGLGLGVRAMVRVHLREAAMRLEQRDEALEVVAHVRLRVGERVAHAGLRREVG